jgi:hypothetical protein
MLYQPCPYCGGPAKGAKARWRPTPGYEVGCRRSHCKAQMVTAVFPRLAEARREWNAGHVSPRPIECPTCKGFGEIAISEFPILSREHTQAVCIECQGAGKVPRRI